MDQPAFRAALHATGAPFATLADEFNCRGHDRKRGATHGSTAVPLRCAGFAEADLAGAGAVAASLRGGAGCAVLHSHDIREPG